MNARQEKKLRTICDSFVKIGAFVPIYAEKKLLRAGRQVVSDAYKTRYENFKLVGTFKLTLSENVIYRYIGAY